MNDQQNFHSQAPSFQSLIFDIQGRVATITLHRPDAANGLDTTMAQELALAAQQCANNAAIKAVILTGSGRFFSAGGDIKAMVGFGDQVADGIKSIADNLHKALSIFARMEAPLIVAVNGTAAGAGFSMAISGDLVLAVDSAKFTMAYSKIGLSPDGGSTYYLPRLVGLRRTQELMLSNRVLDANEALHWGLINRVVAAEKLINEANRLANEFAKGSKQSTGAIKRLLLETLNNTLETQLDLESRTISACAEQKDGREGVAAFVDKRPPSFE
jgi:2-(1,2-epoxy-1,2-dihydrophenyl)acetyl-CoA isomerase